MNARAVLRALGVVVFIVVGMTILIVPATFGLYVDGQNQRMGPESAPTMMGLRNRCQSPTRLLVVKGVRGP